MSVAIPVTRTGHTAPGVRNFAGKCAHAALVCDGAGRHQTGGQPRVPDNITLLHLPAYAPELNSMESELNSMEPELNSMENVWEYPRANKLSRLVWDSFDAIAAAFQEGWNFLINDPERIRSIGHRDWACVNVSSAIV